MNENCVLVVLTLDALTTHAKSWNECLEEVMSEVQTIALPLRESAYVVQGASVSVSNPDYTQAKVHALCYLCSVLLFLSHSSLYEGLKLSGACGLPRA